MIEKHFVLQLTQARHLTQNSTLVRGQRKDLLGTQFKQGDQVVYFVMFVEDNELNRIIHALNVRSFVEFETAYDYVKQSDMALTVSSLPMFAAKIPTAA